MKGFKKIIVWVCISLLLQSAGMIYLNNYLFKAGSGKIVTVKIVKNETPVNKNVEIKIPDNVKHINNSFDGKYLSYYEGDILKIVNTKTGSVKDIEYGDGIKVSYYKWLSDRNRMLIAEKHTTKNRVSFKLAYYDVDKDTKEEIKELTWADTKSEVEDIQASTLTNLIYVKVAQSGKRSSIYWINIMKEMKTVETKSYVIGSIRVLPHDDKIVYEDLAYNKIYATGVTKAIAIQGVNKPNLLDVDGNDVIYIGAEEKEKITAIYSGTLKQNTSEWKKNVLSQPVDRKDIYISQEGNIYLNDNLKGVVTELITGKKTSYEGIFLQMYSEGIMTSRDKKLVKTSYK